jgi:hypothetical protein
MSQLSLKELGKEIKKQQAVADSDPGQDIHTRRHRLGNIAQAKERLEGLRLEYRKQILANAIFIVVTGKEAKKFASIAEKSCGCFSVNSDDFYKDLIENVPAALFEGKTSSGNLLEFISNNLEEKARSLDIVSYPGITMESKYKKVLKDEKDLLALTKAVINEKVGSELVGIDAAQRITAKLLKSKNAGKKVPIVLQTNDSSIVEELAKGLKRSLTRKTFIISTGDELEEKVLNISFDTVAEVTEESVEKSLLKLNKSLV